MIRGPVAATRRARVGRGVAGLIVAILAGEAITRSGLVDPAYLPPVSTVLLTTGRLLLDIEFLGNVAGTLLAWAAGLAIATAAAVPIGTAIGSSRSIERAATPVIELLRPIPSVALIPLVILLIGRGIDMRVVLVAYAAAWPILVNTITGVRGVDPMAIETARAYGLTRGAIGWRVLLPSAAPFVATGIRIAAGIALIVAISAELIAGGDPGIGTWMLTASQAGSPRELLYAGIVVAGLVGLVLNGAFVTGERRLFGWHHGVREDRL